jgi:prepilin-type N-terminal cleavage/methylation domain-containing protein
MKKGFTLIETFVAITILLISLTGPLSIAAQALRSAYYARDEITAFYLAQEGLEYVYAIRDQNYLANPQEPWLDCLNGVGTAGCSNPTPPNCVSVVGGPANVSCQVDFIRFSATVCPGSGCSPLSVDPNGLFDTDTTGTQSAFTRTLTIVPLADDPGNEIRVTSTVSWVSAGISRQFKLSEDLFNWL